MVKSVYYRIDLERTGALIHVLVADCCRGRPELCEPLAAHASKPLDTGERCRSDRVFNVLFVCTVSSARSIIAKAILVRAGACKFRAFSAGPRPCSELDPHAVAMLERMGHGVSGLHAKNREEFRRPDAPRMDFVFTVCDQAANEECPPWPGQPVSAHWGLPDSVKVDGTDAEKGLAFADAYRTLRHRLTGFVALPIGSLDRISLQKKLDEIGQSDAATTG